MQKTDYELIIIGGGPAGLTAGLYAARGRIKVTLLEKGAIGGQVLVTDWIDNYPGFVEGVTGFDLVEKLSNHAKRFGLKTKQVLVSSVELQGPVKTVILENGEKITAQAIILCTGARPGKLGIPGEKELAGKGVSYCATCDGPFYREQEIAIVGGGNTALQEALYLTKFASKVTVIHRRDEFRATKILQEKAVENAQINFLLSAEVTSVEGDTSGVTHLNISHKNDNSSTLSVTGVFIFIGTIPNNELIPQDQLDLDGSGFIKTGPEMETNIPGVFAAGDICSKNFRQIINAAGEGAVAELSAEHYLGTQV